MTSTTALTTPETPPRRRRSASILGHLKQDTQDVQNDQFSSPNPNVSWIHHKGAWLIHIVIIGLLLMVYDALPAFSSELVWTLTNATYVFGFYIMFHYVKGVPFEAFAGAFDDLTMWEQMDDGDQYTPAKKFFMAVPVGLFLVSTHFAHYDLYLFVLNLAICMVGVVPKLPISHRLRLIVEEEDVEPQPYESTVDHPKLDSHSLKN
ncbi:Protein ORM2 [Wickerhamiella sorbophila]|uniref:Protein ORM2 n=1 Tax=Wickerhamiella sorbophila TaxID=45607 RepID=A0A2T0FF64_9ASCO|nr:Protein ORM2 [Wickerhamiella sorbophila]PRT53614.1 Protein ORM2 [Wickerhamiella sorbophila]